jgi:hypothetical protein
VARSNCGIIDWVPLQLAPRSGARRCHRKPRGPLTRNIATVVPIDTALSRRQREFARDAKKINGLKATTKLSVQNLANI